MLSTFFPLGAIIFQMKQLLKDTWKAGVPILLSAFAAAALTFGQSIATQAGFCPAPVAGADQTGLLAAAIKAGHTAFHLIRYGTV